MKETEEEKKKKIHKILLRKVEKMKEELEVESIRKAKERREQLKEEKVLNFEKYDKIEII